MFLGKWWKWWRFTEAQCEGQRLRLLGLWEKWLSLSTTTHPWQLPRQVRDICQHTHIPEYIDAHTGDISDNWWKVEYGYFLILETHIWNFKTGCIDTKPTCEFEIMCFLNHFFFFWQSGLHWLSLTAQPFSWCGESRQQWWLVLICLYIIFLNVCPSLFQQTWE